MRERAVTILCFAIDISVVTVNCISEDPFVRQAGVGEEVLGNLHISSDILHTDNHYEYIEILTCVCVCA